MVKLIVVKCTKPFEEKTNEGQYYIAYKSKNGNDRVILENGISLLILNFKISYRNPFPRYFEEVKYGYFKNHKECKEIAGKSIDELLELLPYNG